MPGTELSAAQPAQAGFVRFALIATVITVLLGGVYWLFLRESFVPVLQELDSSTAAEVAKVLDEKKIPYRFEQEGQTVAVVSDQVDKARVELAGSDLAMRGQIGFELFDQSDMGLTEFAQKINFQRALQGELARTILLFDGIQSVRVHLALPDRGLFRDQQSQPKAAVTVVLKPGKALSAASVAGIQRLVAGSVDGLSVDAVAVLDGTAHVVSTDPQPATPPEGDGDAVITSAKQRIMAAIALDRPGLRVGVNVSLRYRLSEASQAEQSAETAPASEGAEHTGERQARRSPEYNYIIRVTTAELLSEDARNSVRNSIADAVEFNPEQGDSLTFLVGPVLVEPAQASSPVDNGRTVARVEAEQPQRDYWPSADLLTSFGAVTSLFCLAILMVVWRRSRLRRDKALADFAEHLNRRFDPGGEPSI